MIIVSIQSMCMTEYNVNQCESTLNIQNAMLRFDKVTGQNTF